MSALLLTYEKIVQGIASKRLSRPMAPLLAPPTKAIKGYCRLPMTSNINCDNTSWVGGALPNSPSVPPPTKRKKKVKYQILYNEDQE